MDQNNQITFTTKHTQELHDALKNKGINAILEYHDGHKHVDLAIIEARIFIEVDGLHHFTDPNQIIRDFDRDHFSDGDDFDTIHIPNIIIEHHLEEVAKAITDVVKSRLNNS
jgi:very-short-patch-repair endonuclease